MKSVLIIFGFMVLMTSCESEEQIPDYVMSEERFAEVLTEVQIAETIVRLGYHRNSDSLYLNDSIYGSALKKMEVSKADFDSNMTYYLNNPEKFERVYDLVLNTLSTRSAEQE